MQIKLVVVAGAKKEQEVSLSLPATIGRSRDAELTVGHPMISRKHCELHEVDGLVVVRDLGSLNGTFVGGEQIVEEVALRPGNQFSVGPLTFQVDYEGPQPAGEESDDAIPIQVEGETSHEAAPEQQTVMTDPATGDSATDNETLDELPDFLLDPDDDSTDSSDEDDLGDFLKGLE